MFVGVVSELGKKFSTVPLGLAVRLQMIRRREHVVQVHKPKDGLEQP